MNSFVGGRMQGDIRANAVFTQNLQSSSVNLLLITGVTTLSAGQLGLDYKNAGTLALTLRAGSEYTTVLAYVMDNAIIAVVTMLSSPGIIIVSDGVNIQITNSGAPQQASLSALWL